MQAELSARKSPAALRIVKCLLCRHPVRLILAVRQHGLCPRCVEDEAALRWRVVYDRERSIGAIPQNLRAAYNL